jgi:hypothetical protein
MGIRLEVSKRGSPQMYMILQQQLFDSTEHSFLLNFLQSFNSNGVRQVSPILEKPLPY